MRIALDTLATLATALTAQIRIMRGARYWIESPTECTGAMQATGPLRKTLIPFGRRPAEFLGGTS